MRPTDKLWLRDNDLELLMVAARIPDGPEEEVVIAELVKARKALAEGSGPDLTEQLHALEGELADMRAQLEAANQALQEKPKPKASGKKAS